MKPAWVLAFAITVKRPTLTSTRKKIEPFNTSLGVCSILRLSVVSSVYGFDHQTFTRPCGCGPYVVGPAPDGARACELQDDGKKLAGTRGTRSGGVAVGLAAIGSLNTFFSHRARRSSTHDRKKTAYGNYPNFHTDARALTDAAT